MQGGGSKGRNKGSINNNKKNYFRLFVSDNYDAVYLVHTAKYNNSGCNSVFFPPHSEQCKKSPIMQKHFLIADTDNSLTAEMFILSSV